MRIHRSSSAALATACSLLALSVGAAQAAPTVAPGGEFPFIVAPEQGTEAGMTGLAPAPTGDVWATGFVSTPPPEPTGYNGSSFPIRRFGPAGDVRQTIPDPGGRQIYGLALSPDGSVLYGSVRVAGTPMGIQRISASTGAVLGTFAAPGGAPGNADYVQDLTVAPDGDVYVLALNRNSSSEYASALQRYSAEGVFEGTVVLGHSDGGAGRRAPAFDPRTGDLIVLDSGGVDRYTAAGAYVESFALDPSAPEASQASVRPQDGTIYLLDTERSVVSVYTARGGFAGKRTVPRARFGRIAVARDGMRVWTLRYNEGLIYLLPGDDGQPDPAPTAGPDAAPQDPAQQAPTAPASPSSANEPSPAPAPAPASAPAPGPAPDTTGPVVRIVGATQTRTASRSGVVTLKLGPVLENVTGTVTLKSAAPVSARAAAAARRVVTLGRRSLSVAKGRTATVRVTLSRANRALLKRLRVVRVAGTVVLRDAAGNKTSRTFRFRLKAPGR